MRLPTLTKFLALFFVFGFLFVSCQRSPAYTRDETYYGGEARNYYGASGASPTKRLEMLGQPKKKIIVLDFHNDTPVPAETMTVFAADELRRHLFQTRRMIVDPDLRSKATTSDFIQGTRVKVGQLIREGRRLGVSVIVIGRIAKVVFRQRGDEVGLLRQKQSLAGVDVEIKMFDVTGGREIMATGKSGEASSSAMVAFEEGNLKSRRFREQLIQFAMRNAVKELVPDVIKSVEKMTWQGKIAKIVGEKVYVNAGRQSGLVGGDILRVVTQGDDIFDPETGAYLGRSKGQLKGTVEVLDFIGKDGAVAKMHTGGNFTSGDVVRLY